MSTNIVSINELSKAFPERPVLEDVTFGIDEGDRLGLIGFNGSGKSTLLSLVAGRIEPTPLTEELINAVVKIPGVSSISWLGCSGSSESTSLVATCPGSTALT